MTFAPERCPHRAQTKIINLTEKLFKSNVNLTSAFEVLLLEKFDRYTATKSYWANDRNELDTFPAALTSERNAIL